MRRTTQATIAILALLALGAPAKADSVSVQQSPFNASFGFGFLPGAFGLLLFPGPYQLTFQTNPSFQTNTFVEGSLDVLEMNYDSGGTVDVLGPNGFHFSGTLTEAMAETFTAAIAILGFPVGSDVGFGVSGAFTGSLTDGERWQGTFGVEQNFCCNEPAPPSFLQMMSVPEPGTLLLLCAGMFGLILCIRRFAIKLSGQ
jgi:PEP-CTERM motif